MQTNNGTVSQVKLLQYNKVYFRSMLEQFQHVRINTILIENHFRLEL